MSVNVIMLPTRFCASLRIKCQSTFHRRFHSTATVSNRMSLSRYGLGGQNWKKFNPQTYQQLIFDALSRGVSYLEIAGPDGGEIAMVGAVQCALERHPDFAKVPVTVTTRLGYRTLQETTGTTTGNGPSSASSGEINGAAISGRRLGDVQLLEDDQAKTSTYVTPSNVVHNISSEYILDTIKTSPLLELQQEMENLKLVFLLHNPEVQVVELLQDHPHANVTERQEFIQQRWTPTMEALEDYVHTSPNSNAFSFGIVSNGLGIPSKMSHPMQLDASLVVEASKRYHHFSTVELPANMMETYGWEVAREIKSEAPNVTVAAFRPLTGYPCLGTSSGFPFRLVDYALPTLEDNSVVTFDDEAGSIKPGKGYRYTNDMSGIPSVYQVALQAAMSHFDAEELLEIKQQRDLTVQERETLDGCKLMQSMIHDLDNGLANVSSFAAHEDELYGKIIPLIYDTFEVMDDKTSDVLQVRKWYC
jgi:hypothetical protein